MDSDGVDIKALDELERTFMFCNVLEKPVPGHWGEDSPKLVQRLEWVLEVLQEQRHALTYVSFKKKAIPESVLRSLTSSFLTTTCLRS